jgi:molecular chaperone GrpE
MNQCNHSCSNTNNINCNPFSCHNLDLEDLESYKERIKKDAELSIKQSNMGLICYFLPILDNLEKAMDCTNNFIRHPLSSYSYLTSSKEEGFIAGIKIIIQQFKDILDHIDVHKIDVDNQKFDPKFHYAIQQVVGTPGMIVAEVESGYMYKGEVLRPAKVIVGKSSEVKNFGRPHGNSFLYK